MIPTHRSSLSLSLFLSIPPPHALSLSLSLSIPLSLHLLSILPSLSPSLPLTTPKCLKEVEQLQPKELDLSEFECNLVSVS